MTFRVRAYEHVGIRVTDRDAARAFYAKLGWREAVDLPAYHANEMVNDAGVYINLIFNGVKRPGGRNILQDEPLKYPGVTHAAFVVDDMDDLIRLQARTHTDDGRPGRLRDTAESLVHSRSRRQCIGVQRID
jgi:catechol 2,3-dioxygenase-like lactoylglutathione lyase family enzyme